MTPRDNMLEAFRDASGKGPSSSAGPFASGGASAGASPGAGPGAGKVAGTGTSGGAGAGAGAARAKAVLARARPLAAAGALPAARLAVLGFAALGLAFVLGVLVGRGSRDGGNDVLAAAPGDAGAAGAALSTGADPLAAPAARPAEPGAGTAPPTGPAAGAPDTAALWDPANKYTVVAITYGSTQEELAWTSYEHLRAHDLPAFPPVAVGENIVVLVGAARAPSELEAARRELRELPGPDGRGTPYAEAYTRSLRPLVGATPPAGR